MDIIDKRKRLNALNRLGQKTILNYMFAIDAREQNVNGKKCVFNNLFVGEIVVSFYRILNLNLRTSHMGFEPATS